MNNQECTRIREGGGEKGIYKLTNTMAKQQEEINKQGSEQSCRTS